MARDESNGFERNGGTRGSTKATESLDGLIDGWLDRLGREFAARGGASGREKPLDEDGGVIGVLFWKEVASLHRLSLRVRGPLPPNT
jgi:hypothetical protein